MSLRTRIRKSWNSYLERLAKENKQMFPDGKPSCCSMNRQPLSSSQDGKEIDEAHKNHKSLGLY